MPRVKLEYFAQFGDLAGCRTEIRDTDAVTAAALYGELQRDYGFAFSSVRMRVAVNAQFCPWNQSLKDDDHVVFIPPVTGG